MPESKHVKIDMKGLTAYRQTIARDLVGGGGTIRKAFRQMAAVYRSFLQLRFDAYSKGGGNWKPLAESTKARRRKARKGHSGSRSFSVLRDTSTMFNVLSPVFSGAPGAIEQELPNGLLVGFGGPGAHPDGNATVADIASFHDAGGGRLPQREIVVEPDSAALNRMQGILETACRGIADQTKL
jgi:hypothetical protein